MSGDQQPYGYAPNGAPHEATAHGYCPWMGKLCVGPDNCAPARLGATLSATGEEIARCPIVSVVDVISAAGVLLGPMLENAIGMVSNETDPEKRDREHVLNSLQIDQEPRR